MITSNDDCSQERATFPNRLETSNEPSIIFKFYYLVPVFGERNRLPLHRNI